MGQNNEINSEPNSEPQILFNMNLGSELKNEPNHSLAWRGLIFSTLFDELYHVYGFWINLGQLIKFRDELFKKMNSSKWTSNDMVISDESGSNSNSKQKYILFGKLFLSKDGHQLMVKIY
jgi:hypothetical protein